MGELTLNNNQLETMIAVLKETQRRLLCHGMPELDQELVDLVDILEQAHSLPDVPLSEDAPV